MLRYQAVHEADMVLYVIMGVLLRVACSPASASYVAFSAQGQLFIYREGGCYCLR